MALNYYQNRGLPRLAWLASVEQSSGQCNIQHGCSVETREQFFVEGIWPGAFQAGGFEQCEAFFGSGAVQHSPDEIAFVPSSATVDYLYYSNTAHRFMCSNSLPFLLAECDDELDAFDPVYSGINESITKGIDSYEQTIPTRRGSVIRLMYYNLILKAGLVRKAAKPLPPAFRSFEQYRKYLADSLANMIKNARDKERLTPLRIVSTQSSGYDTTAINAILRDHSPDVTLSISEPKERRLYFSKKQEANRPSDSGEQICKQLGIKMDLIDRRHVLKDPDSEALYWAGMNNCQDLNLHQVCEHVGQGAVLLTGVLGELWCNAKSTPPERLAAVNDQLERWDLSGHSLSEARLHLGYVHAPVPYIGARSRRSIFDLSNSESMRQWSISGTYDRPIPRRLGEGAGVTRHLFGQTKLATVVELLPPYMPLGRPLKREFSRFLKQKRGQLGFFWIVMLPKINCAIWNARSYVLALPYWIRDRRPGRLALRARTIGGRYNAVLYAFCVNKTGILYSQIRSGQ